jgi:hypothetical protein
MRAKVDSYTLGTPLVIARVGDLEGTVVGERKLMAGWTLSDCEERTALIDKRVPDIPLFLVSASTPV